MQYAFPYFLTVQSGRLLRYFALHGPCMDDIINHIDYSAHLLVSTLTRHILLHSLASVTGSIFKAEIQIETV